MALRRGRRSQQRYPSPTTMNRALVLTLMLLTSLTSSARPLGILVPAYGNPHDSSGAQMWQVLTAQATIGQVQVTAIINPASGPGNAQAIDPNYVMPNGMGPALSFRQAGGVLVGYVATGYGSRELNTVKAEIDQYFDPSYWRGAGVLISGIFFDEMSNDLALLAYYRALRAHVAQKSSQALTIGNPGTSQTYDSSAGAAGHTVDDYASVFQVLMTFEDDGGRYATTYTPPAWVRSHDARHFAHVVHSVASAAQRLEALTLARERKAGWVYVTHDVLDNPYDEIAIDFAEQLKQIALDNPKHTTFAVPGSGMAALFAIIVGLGSRLIPRLGKTER